MGRPTCVEGRAIDGDDQHALTIDALRAAIAALTEADYKRLHTLSHVFAKLSELTAEELVQEAVMRALEGTRRCPADVPVIVFLGNAMKSIASSARRAASSPRLHVALDMTGTDGLAQVLESEQRSPEQCVLAREDFQGRIAALDALFAEDTEAQMLIEAIKDGAQGADICALWGWNSGQLATVRRRVRNTMLRHFPRGYEA